MPVPTNISAATALGIGTLPYTITLDAFEVPTDSLWFRLDVAVAAYTGLAFATPVPDTIGTYTPQIVVWTGTPGSLTPYLFMQADYPQAMAIPQPASPLTFFFEVRRAFGSGAFTEQVRFDFEGGPVAAAPAESIFVSDDSNGYPAVVISSTTGEILQTFPFPSGETADRLSTGKSLWHDATNDTFVLYSPQFVELATTPWPAAPSFGQWPIQASATQFYVGDPGNVSGPAINAIVTTVSAAGVLGPTTWDLGAPSVRSLAVNRAETILYYRTTTGGGPAVQRWDLVNDLPLSDLVAATGVGTNASADLIVLDDDTILVPYVAVAGTVKRYSAAGALLNTYTTARLNRIARSSDNLTTFWVWLFPDADYSTFQQIRISDGAVLKEVTAPQSDDGILRPPSTAPQQGPSNSCPFITTPEALPALFGEEAAAVYRVRNNLIRRQRRTPYLVDENRWTFHREIVVDLEPGVGVPSGQGVNPQVMLRWSDDGAKTWSNEHWCTAGRQGVYTARAIWRVLGRSRGRVYEITVSDPVAWNVAAAYIDAGPGVRG